MLNLAKEAKKKPNWIKIRNEYETSNISQRKLAVKYNVPYNTLRHHSEREQWNKRKEEVQRKISAISAQKSELHAIDVATALNDSHNYVWELLKKQIKDTLETKPRCQNPITAEVQEYDYDPKDLDALSKALDKIQKGQRLAKNILSKFEADKLAIERDKLEWERKQKLEEETKDKEIKIIIEDASLEDWSG